MKAPSLLVYFGHILGRKGLNVRSKLSGRQCSGWCAVYWMMHCCHFISSILVDIVVVLQAAMVLYLPLQSDLMFLLTFSGYRHLTELQHLPLSPYSKLL